jgi:hypothetical protein
LSVSASGIIKPGKIKVTGTILHRVDLQLVAGINFNNLTVNVAGEIKQFLQLQTLPANTFIARVDFVQNLSNSELYDVNGVSLNSNVFSISTGTSDSSVGKLAFRLPQTQRNISNKPSSGSSIFVSLLVAIPDHFEELYFPLDSTVITDKVFGRIDRISVSSGFRAANGSLSGSIVVNPLSQPNPGTSYGVNYNFIAPKEGERITVRYNINRLILDATTAIEPVRSITADILVKEAPELVVDVSGQLIISDESILNTNTIVESASNAIVNLLNTSTLGSTIDYSDIISVVSGIPGVDSINISTFNESGKTGRKTFIKALENQSISAGSIILTAVPRQDFRIT